MARNISNKKIKWRRRLWMEGEGVLMIVCVIMVGSAYPQVQSSSPSEEEQVQQQEQKLSRLEQEEAMSYPTATTPSAATQPQGPATAVTSGPEQTQSPNQGVDAQTITPAEMATAVLVQQEATTTRILKVAEELSVDASGNETGTKPEILSTLTKEEANEPQPSNAPSETNDEPLPPVPQPPPPPRMPNMPTFKYENKFSKGDGRANHAFDKSFKSKSRNQGKGNASPWGSGFGNFPHHPDHGNKQHTPSSEPSVDKEPSSDSPSRRRDKGYSGGQPKSFTRDGSGSEYYHIHPHEHFRLNLGQQSASLSNVLRKQPDPISNIFNLK